MNRKYNFDDLGKALMSLFVLSSRDGWVNIMYTGLDAVGVDQQVYKIFTMLFGRHFVWHLFKIVSVFTADRKLFRMALTLLHLIYSAGWFLRAEHVCRSCC